MSKYTTVRIDNDTMQKLEYIAQVLQKNSLGKVSKALAIKHIVTCEYEKITFNETCKEEV